LRTAWWREKQSGRIESHNAARMRMVREYYELLQHTLVEFRYTATVTDVSVRVTGR
jgi:hypothetical protein